MELAGGLGYLATPYTGLDREWAIEQAEKWMIACNATLLVPPKTYACVTSPILQGIRMEKAEPFCDWTHDDWMAWCHMIFSGCHYLVVPNIPGWRQSKGIAIEIGWAKARQMPIRYPGRAEIQVRAAR